MSERDGRLSVGIVGSGRVGPVVGAALAGAGHRIVGISAGSNESRDRAEALLPGVPIRDVPELVAEAELIVLAVPDAELESLVAGLAAVGAWQPGQIVVHTSPAFGTSVLEPALLRGAIPVALHPAMSFTGTSMDLARLAESYVVVTAPTPVLPIGQALAVEMGGEPVVIHEADRAAYAEAISTAMTFSAAIVSQATEILRKTGVENPAAILAPLIRSTVDNALRTSSPGGGTEILGRLERGL